MLPSSSSLSASSTSSAKKILITGAAAGFGSLIARSLVAAGHTVFASMRDPQGRNRTKAEALRAFALGKAGALHVLELDVASEASAEAAVREAVSIAGGLDILINNAGVGHGLGTYAEAVSMEQFQRSFDINVFGVQRVTRAALPALRKSGSALILNLSSIMGRIVLPYSATYTATKYAVEGLSESYRYELSGVGVEVVIVEPGGFPTEFFSSVEGPADAGRLAGYGPLADAPAKLYGPIGEMIHGANAPDPQAVADAVLRVVEMPAGTRPLRVVVDPLMGGSAPEAVNKTGIGVQADLFDAIGQKDLLVLKGLD
jgi:NAD(P)-dependent dehydrogenase (short-subunit alcohol dehydrogenase family)